MRLPGYWRFWSGILADREDRRLIIYVFQGIQMVCPVFIVALVAMGWVQVWMIIAVSLVVGITDALSAPAFSSLIPSIVSRSEACAGPELDSVQFIPGSGAGHRRFDHAEVRIPLVFRR